MADFGIHEMARKLEALEAENALLKEELQCEKAMKRLAGATVNTAVEFGRSESEQLAALKEENARLKKPLEAMVKDAVLAWIARAKANVLATELEINRMISEGGPDCG